MICPKSNNSLTSDIEAQSKFIKKNLKLNLNYNKKIKQRDIIPKLGKRDINSLHENEQVRTIGLNGMFMRDLVFILSLNM